MIWLMNHKEGYNSITLRWLDELKPPRIIQSNRTSKAVMLDEVLAMANATAENLLERRTRASAVFLFHIRHACRCILSPFQLKQLILLHYQYCSGLSSEYTPKTENAR